MALAIRLAYETAQRPTDVLRLAWAQSNGSGFTLTQSKTDEAVYIPEPSYLAVALNATVGEDGDYLVISETTKRPYKRHHFAHEFARIRKLAELPATLQFRDLRRTAATELGNSGATDDE